MKHLVSLNEVMIPTSQLPWLRRLLKHRRRLLKHRYLPLGVNLTIKDRALMLYRRRVRRVMYRGLPTPRLAR
jgi:hypothetical protein